jgi:hypothetical protein
LMEARSSQPDAAPADDRGLGGSTVAPLPVVAAVAEEGAVALLPGTAGVVAAIARTGTMACT